MRSTGPEEAGRLDEETLRALLMLKAAPGLGDLGIGVLLERHQSPVAALAGLAAHAPKAAAGLRSRPVQGRVDRALQTLTAGRVATLVIGAPRFPDFGNLHDPPPVLFAVGDLALLERPAVAVVGSRRHTEYGAEATHRIAEDLARAGVVVASGLAHGIDRIAHEAALDCGGSTLAVIGSGIDVEYPAANAALQRQIGREGLLLSEFLPGEPALPHHFPKRNRLLAALTQATIVVEAARRSGSLITVDHALDLGRDVFAVPGPIGRATSEGTNRLIQDGAHVLISSDDVLSLLGLAAAHDRARAGVPEPSTGPAHTVWTALSDGPLHVDDLSRNAGLGPAATLEVLLEMELAGQVRQFPGRRFGRAA